MRKCVANGTKSCGCERAIATMLIRAICAMSGGQRRSETRGPEISERYVVELGGER